MLEKALHDTDPDTTDVIVMTAKPLPKGETPVENEFLPARAAVVGAGTMLELGAVYASLKDSLPAGLEALPGAAPGPKFTTG